MVELNVQLDHVHALVLVPPKVSISDIDGHIEGTHRDSAIQAVSISEGEAVLGNHFGRVVIVLILWV